MWRFSTFVFCITISLHGSIGSYPAVSLSPSFIDIIMEKGICAAERLRHAVCTIASVRPDGRSSGGIEWPYRRWGISSDFLALFTTDF